MTARRSGRRLLLTLLLVAATMDGAIAGPAQATPGPASAPEWWFDTWHVPQLWAAGADGRGITVAVIDTGVQASLPQLSGKVLPGADFISNGTDGRTDFDGDAFSHGTAMASLIAAAPGVGNIEGLAPGAKILPVAVPLQGVIRNGPLPTSSPTPTAIRWAADHGARIISMSLGGIRDEAEDAEPCPPAIQSAVVYALGKGALVVAAAGNSGEDGSPVEEPGVCLGVVSVGSVDAAEVVSTFSSRHPYLTLTAPGDQIASLSRQPGVAYVGGGTSQATALASAAMALVWSKYPSETNRQVLDRVLTTVVDRGPKGRDPAYGLGVIDPNAAVAATSPAPQSGTTDPVFTGVQPLLALAQPAAAPAPVTAAGVADADLGPVRVGTVPGLAAARVYGLAAAAVVLLLLAVLLAGSALRRRHRRRVAATVNPWIGASS